MIRGLVAVFRWPNYCRAYIVLDSPNHTWKNLAQCSVSPEEVSAQLVVAGDARPRGPGGGRRGRGGGERALGQLGARLGTFGPRLLGVSRSDAAAATAGQFP